MDTNNGELCLSLMPFEIISYNPQGQMSGTSIMPEGEVFLILSSSEINEIPAWEFEIMHKSLTYYFNVPAMQGIFELDGQDGLYNFPFKRLKSDYKQVRR